MGKSHKEQVFRENQACYGAMERTRESQRGSPSDDPWSQGEEDALCHICHKFSWMRERSRGCCKLPQLAGSVWMSVSHKVIT